MHNEEVVSIQKKLKTSGVKNVLRTNAPSNTLKDGSYKLNTQKIDISRLHHILEINEEECWVKVEPRVTMLELVRYTLKRGLIPLVVPEFTSITVGGAIMGAAIESSSHLHGQFNDSCLELELILGDGSCVLASPSENSDLFYGISGSYGTLALLTCAKIRLRKALPYVQMSLQHFSTQKEFLEALRIKPHSDFIEGVAISSSHFCVITASFTARGKPSRKTYASRWYCQEIAERKQRLCMTTFDYLFRFDRGGFWMGRFLLSYPLLLRTLFHLNFPQIAAELQPLPLTPSLFLRLFFGWAFSSRFLYKRFHKVPKNILENTFFIHDFYVPLPKIEEALTHFTTQTQIYPIWACPVKGGNEEQILSPHYGHEKFINFGFYGMAKTPLSFPALTASLEKKITELGGRKMLYSFSYYSKEDFSKIYVQNRYESLRLKYHATAAFPSLYDKTVA